MNLDDIFDWYYSFNAILLGYYLINKIILENIKNLNQELYNHINL